ncbi:hypothetical protein CAPTEDRAFT_205710, partial [Capitella teleta]
CPVHISYGVVNIVPYKDDLGAKASQVQYTANFTGFSSKFFGVPFSIYCTSKQMIVIQKRTSPFVLSFDRTFQENRDGFGDVTGEFWLGLDKIHQITSDPRVKYE